MFAPVSSDKRAAEMGRGADHRALDPRGGGADIVERDGKGGVECGACHGLRLYRIWRGAQTRLMRQGLGRAGRSVSTFPERLAPMKRFLAIAAALMFSSAALADTLVDNVNGYTLDGNRKLVRFTGIVIGNDGRVKELLSRRDKRPERPDYRLEGRGRTLIPGLIDAHGHVMGLGFQSLQLDLSETNSLQEAQAKIAAFAAAHPSPRWIVGRGWNQERWDLGRFPTAADIDAVVKDRPVWLERIDGHAGWANSLAMKEAAIDAKTASPAGGRIEKAGGQPSGIFVDAAAELVGKAVPPPLAPHPRPGASPTRRRSCSPTASPRSPTWAPAPRIGW